MSQRTVAERQELGRNARANVPRSSQADFTPAADRPDPVALIQEQNATRVRWLVPVRHYRMAASPFTFYRGTARIMATDLAGTPSSGLEVQLGGDAHLSNFGAYASPERTLVVDANDFDETLRGPWEWDLKRLTTSFTIAARHRGFRESQARRITALVAQSYREAMAGYAEMGFLELWYEMTPLHGLVHTVDAIRLDRRGLRAFEKRARSRTSWQARRKLAEEVAGSYRLRSQRPLLVPIRELAREHDPDRIDSNARAAFEQYLGTLRADRRELLERYRLADVAMKIVGVGSVGTRCYVLLLEGRDHNDPLILQAKEANASVLEEQLGPSPIPHHGQRVVEGRRMIQAQSDVFLGWASDQSGVQYYVRQFRDWKASFDVEGSTPRSLANYARICGTIMARGHARTGDPEAISAYLGGSSKFDDALVAFSQRYADQTLVDYERFMEAIRDGALPYERVDA